MEEINKGTVIKLLCEEADEGFKLFGNVSNPEDEFKGLYAYLEWIDGKVAKALNCEKQQLAKMDYDYISDIRRQIHVKVISKVDFLKSSLK